MGALQLVSAVLLFIPLTEAYVTRDTSTLDRVDQIFSGRVSQLNSNDYDITTAGNVLTGVVQQERTVIVSSLIDELMPSLSTELSNSPLHLEVIRFTVDLNTETLTIAASLPSLTIVQGFFNLNGVSGTVTVHFEEGASITERYSLQEIQMEGQWDLAELCIRFRVHFPLSADEFRFQGEPCDGDLQVDNLISAVGARMLPEGKLQMPLENAGLNKISIQEARIAGVYSKGVGFALSMSGNPTVEGWGTFRGHVILHRYSARAEPGETARTVVTIGLDLTAQELADVPLRIANLDVSRLPVISSLIPPNIGLLISTDDVGPNLLPNTLDGILTNFNPIEKGAGLTAAIPLVPTEDPIQFILILEPGRLHFSIAHHDDVLSLRNVLDALTPGVNIDDTLAAVPPGVHQIVDELLSLHLTRFEYIHSPISSLLIELTLDSPLDLIPNVVTINNTTLFLNVTLSSPRKVSFKAKGTWRIAGIDFRTQLEPLSLKRFRCTASADEISIADLVTKFEATFLPAELQAPLAKANLVDFKILTPILSLTVGGDDGLAVQVAGIPSINGWTGVTVNGLFIFKDGSVTVAAGLDFADIGLAGLVEQITGQDTSALSLLNQSLKVGLTLSSKALYNIRLQGPTLSKIPVINRGLTIVAIFGFPANCGGDSFCVFMKDKLGPDVSLQLSVNIESFSQFVISAGVANIKLGEGIVLSKAAIEFGVGAKTYIGVRATLALDNPPLTFQGGIFVGSEGIVLEMDMIGIWKRAFGIPYFAFGNAHIRLAIMPQTLVVALEMGAEVRIGKLDTGKELIAKVYVGIDPEQPNNNFFYGSINKATMQALFNAFDITLSMPKVLAESGFPYGLNASYAVIPKDLDYAGIVVPAGVRINGTMDILGYRVSCLIDINIPTGLVVDIELDPLTIAGGLIKMWRSK